MDKNNEDIDTKAQAVKTAKPVNGTLPEGAVLVGTPVEITNNSNGQTEQQPAPAFNDEHVGKGGSYVIGEDGVRRRVYEAYTAEDGTTQYRPVA